MGGPTGPGGPDRHVEMAVRVGAASSPAPHQAMERSAHGHVSRWGSGDSRRGLLRFRRRLLLDVVGGAEGTRHGRDRGRWLADRVRCAPSSAGSVRHRSERWHGIRHRRHIIRLLSWASEWNPTFDRRTRGRADVQHPHRSRSRHGGHRRSGRRRRREARR